jgi:hypothetical protein
MRSDFSIQTVLIAGSKGVAKHLFSDMPTAAGHRNPACDNAKNVRKTLSAAGVDGRHLFEDHASGVALYLNRRLRSEAIHDLDAVNSKLLHLNRRLLHLIRGLISPSISGVVLIRRHAPHGNLRFKCSSFHELNPVDRLSVHELSAVNGHRLRFKCRATTAKSRSQGDRRHGTSRQH